MVVRTGYAARAFDAGGWFVCGFGVAGARGAYWGTQHVCS
jgi:hypothetical protein